MNPDHPTEPKLTGTVLLCLKDAIDLSIDYGGGAVGAFPMPTGALGVHYEAHLPPNHNLVTPLTNGAPFVQSGNTALFAHGAATTTAAAEVPSLMPSGAVSPTTWPQLVGAVQKASADASAARAEAAKATERVKNLEAKLEALDSQREPSIGPAPTPKKTSCVLRNTKLENRIHQKLLSMLGLTYKGRGKYTVPDFPADISDLAIPDESEAATWTPIWTKP
ncbi:hypothetical protein FOMPIDRAFT_1013850, partial [Fomitopsis schrenkii]